MRKLATAVIRDRSPVLAANQFDRPLAVIDFQPVGFKQRRAEQAFRSRSDQGTRLSVLGKPPRKRWHFAIVLHN